jgi:hypothetical protein
MPAAIRWPEHIPAGTRTHSLSATYDIFSTMLALAGVDEPNDRVIDGRDLSPILFGDYSTTEIHDCLYFYGGTPGAGSNCDEHEGCPGLWAVRCGAYKVHWVTTDYNSSTKFWDPPLLFDINADPSERHPIWPDDDNYTSIVANITAMRDSFVATVDLSVTNQILLGSNPEYMICCNPLTSPPCSCSSDNWDSWVCEPKCAAISSCGTRTLNSSSGGTLFDFPRRGRLLSVLFLHYFVIYYF